MTLPTAFNTHRRCQPTPLPLHSAISRALSFAPLRLSTHRRYRDGFGCIQPCSKSALPNTLYSGCLYALTTPYLSVWHSNFNGNLPNVSPRILRQAKYVASDNLELSVVLTPRKSSNVCAVMLSAFSVFRFQNAANVSPSLVT